MLADSANISQEGKLNITGIFDRINAQEFPAAHMAAKLVLNVEVHPGEVGRHEMKIVFVDEDGKLVMESKVGFVVGEPDDKSKPIRGNQIITIQVIPMAAPGDYSFDIFIDGRYETSVPLTAAKVGG